MFIFGLIERPRKCVHLAKLRGTLSSANELYVSQRKNGTDSCRNCKPQRNQFKKGSYHLAGLKAWTLHDMHNLLEFNEKNDSECRCNHRHTCSSLRVTKIATLLGFAQWVWPFHQILPVDTTSTGPGLARTDSNCARFTAMGYLAPGAPTGGIHGPGFPTEFTENA